MSPTIEALNIPTIPCGIGAWMNLTDRAVSHLVHRWMELEQSDAIDASTLRRIRGQLQPEPREEAPF